MKCAYCREPLRVWQKQRPLGCGYLRDTFGQREHKSCSDARRIIIEKGIKDREKLFITLKERNNI